MKTRLRQNIHPDITRPDTEIALVGKWQVDDPDHQKTAGDAAIDIWNFLAWPDGLLSHSVYLGNDDTTILQYSQWTGDEAIETFTSEHLTERAKKAHETVPGLERVEAVKYRHYKSMLSNDFSRHAGCIIIVSFKTDDLSDSGLSLIPWLIRWIMVKIVTIPVPLPHIFT